MHVIKRSISIVQMKKTNEKKIKNLLGRKKKPPKRGKKVRDETNNKGKQGTKTTTHEINRNNDDH